MPKEMIGDGIIVLSARAYLRCGWLTVQRYMCLNAFDNETQVYKYFVNGKRNTKKVGFNRIEAYQRI